MDNVSSFILCYFLSFHQGSFIRISVIRRKGVKKINTFSCLVKEVVGHHMKSCNHKS